jgi:hypothetical protein
VPWHLGGQNVTLPVRMGSDSRFIGDGRFRFRGFLNQELWFHDFW